MSSLNYLKILIFVFPFLTGLYSGGSCAIAALALMIYLIWHLHETGRLTVWINLTSVCLTVFYLLYLAVTIWAIDPGMAFHGFIRISPCLIFMIVLMQLKSGEVRELFPMIAYSGVCYVLFGLFAYYIPTLNYYFYDADRFCGFFNVANEMAIFLLVGLNILAYLKGQTRDIYLMEIVLVVGIFLTGSRTVFVLLLLSVIVLLLVRKKQSRKMLLIFGLCLACVLIYFLVTHDNGSIARFTRLSLGSSEMVGRFIYWKDSLRLIAEYPFGSGFGGFYYWQGANSSAPYSLWYIHNIFLQITADVGFAGLILFLIAIIRTLSNKSVCLEYKIIMSLILLHGLVDFDLEYMILWFILLMTMNLRSGREVVLESKKLFTAVLALLSAAYLYLGAGYLTATFGDLSSAIRILPYETEFKVLQIKKQESNEEVIELAHDVLGYNDTIPVTYEALAIENRQNGEYLDMLRNKYKAVTHIKYNMNRYNEFLKMDQSVYELAKSGDDTLLMDSCRLWAQKLIDFLYEVRESTDPLITQTVDNPDYKLSDESMAFLKSLGIDYEPLSE